MKNKFKKVYSLAHQAGYRNYTVKDLINLKGKKKLTQINVVSPEEAAAAEAAGKASKNAQDLLKEAAVNKTTTPTATKPSQEKAEQ